MDPAQIAMALMLNILKLIAFMWVVHQVANLLGYERYMKAVDMAGGVTMFLIAYNYIGKMMAIADAASKGIFK